MTGPAHADAVAHVFVETLADRCEITGADGHHLQRVRRITPGEFLTAADGSGAWRRYEVTAAAPRALTLDARSKLESVTLPRLAIALAVAPTKGGLDDVISAATELGVERVTPVRTERTVVRWDAARAEKTVARLRVVARGAAMQSRRVRIPVIDDFVALSTMVDRPGLVVADVDGVPASAVPLPDPAAGRFVWTVLVGPEGGLTESERASFTNAPRLCLGPNVLRAATAPVAAVAVLMQQADRLPPA